MKDSCESHDDLFGQNPITTELKTKCGNTTDTLTIFMKGMG